MADDIAPKERTLVLNSLQIRQKITRMAHEIYERNYREKELILVSITGKGKEVAKRIAGVLESISTIKVSMFNLEFDKDSPLSEPMKFSGDLKSLKGRNVILVDDVLNSGRTLAYASKFLLDAAPQKLATATLVDRFHRRFPVRADFVGLTLSTNLKEHVTVEMPKGKEAVYLE